MDSIHRPTDPTERRRLQNRIAQRKFRQKKQLERSANHANHALHDRPDRLSAAYRQKNNADGIDVMPTEGSFSISDSFFALPDTFPEDTPAIHMGHADVLETIDKLLGNCNSSASSLDTPSFPSFFVPANTTQTSRSSSGTASDSATQPVGFPDTGPNFLPNVPDAPTADNTVLELINSIKNGKGWVSTVHIAAQKGHERILRVLLQQGNIDPNSTDSDGRTPLFYAAIGGHEPVVRLLLDHGARMALLDCERRSALHWAVLYQRLEVLRTLLQYWTENELDSYNINAYDKSGWTPLHMAVERGFEEGVLLLIQYGADMDAKAKKCALTGQVIPFDLDQLASRSGNT